MALIDEKIAQFKSEIGDMKMSEEQQIVFDFKKGKCVVRNFVTSYRLVRELGGVKYSLVLKMTTHVHVFKSFYSNRTNKKSLLNIQNPQRKSILSCGSTPSCDATFGDVQKKTQK